MLLDTATPWPWQRIPTPCAQMHLINARIESMECPEIGSNVRGMVLDHALDDDDVDASEIRLRYEIAADERDLGRREAESLRDAWLQRGAVAVKLEEVVIATTRARAPEVAAAQGLADKLRAYWAARDDVPEDDREERLLTMAYQAEEEVRSAV